MMGAAKGIAPLRKVGALENTLREELSMKPGGTIHDICVHKKEEGPNIEKDQRGRKTDIRKLL